MSRLFSRLRDPVFRSKLDYTFGLGALERFFTSKWFNPFMTLYVNFRSFPLSQAIKLPVFIYGRMKIYSLSGRMLVTGNISTGMIVINKDVDGSPQCACGQTEITNNGTIIFKGNGYIGVGDRIRVSFGAVLSLGRGFAIRDFCNIGCFSKISVGDNTWIVHRCQVLDTNYHYTANIINREVGRRTKPISIGSNCWICNSSTIAMGTKLPDYTIVASNSLVNKNFEDIGEFSLLGGAPARVIGKGYVRVDNIEMQQKIDDYFSIEDSGKYHLSDDIDFKQLI